MPFLMLLAAQLFVYFAVVGSALLFLHLSKRSARLLPYRKGVLVGLFASPVGLVAPYLLFGLLVWLCHGTWPTDGIPVIDMIARVFVGLLPIAGPCLGPIGVVLAAAVFYPKNKTA